MVVKFAVLQPVCLFGDHLTQFPLRPGEDQFCVVDASVGYRLPKHMGLISIGVANLFDEKFHFQDTDPANPQIFPSRVTLERLTLAF